MMTIGIIFLQENRSHLCSTLNFSQSDLSNMIHFQVNLVPSSDISSGTLLFGFFYGSKNDFTINFRGNDNRFAKEFIADKWYKVSNSIYIYSKFAKMSIKKIYPLIFEMLSEFRREIDHVNVYVCKLNYKTLDFLQK